MIDFFMGMVGARPVEWLAVFCGVLNVGLIIRRSIWNYPFGLLMVVLYLFIFWQARLYSDALLQIYFFVIQLYGLWNWLGGRAEDGRVRVVPLSHQGFFIWLGFTAVAWLLIGWLMHSQTDAAAPFWDAGIAAFSVTAQFLLARRHLQSWYLWIAVDVMAIGLFHARGLEPTAALYVVFLAMAVTGLIQWRRSASIAIAA